MKNISDSSKMKTVIIRAHFLRLHRKKPGQRTARRSRALAKNSAGFSGVPPRTNQAVKFKPEKLQSNFVSVFTQDGRSRPYNPLRPTGFKKWFHFGTGSIIKNLLLVDKRCLPLMSLRLAR
jgi:hypothetical protein